MKKHREDVGIFICLFSVLVILWGFVVVDCQCNCSGKPLCVLHYDKSERSGEAFLYEQLFFDSGFKVHTNDCLIYC